MSFPLKSLLGSAALLVLAETLRRSASPELGRIVTVQFRRDQLHHNAAGPINASPAAADGQQVTLTGYLVRLDPEWVVLSYTNSVDGNQTPREREAWIPRQAVLFIEVDMDRAPRV